MIDGREEPAPGLRHRPEPRRVRAPEFVRPLGTDPAAVAPVSAGMPPPHRRQQPVWCAGDSLSLIVRWVAGLSEGRIV